MPKHYRMIVLLLTLPVLVLAAPATALAQEAAPNNTTDMLYLLPAALTLLLPIGLILLISSAAPEEQAPATAINLLLIWSVAALAYFAVGFAFQFGGIAQVSPQPDLRGLYWEWYPLDQSVDINIARLWGVIALRGWALSGEAATPGAYRLFLSHVSLVGAAAMLPFGALPRQAGRLTSLLTGLLIGTLIYPLSGNWLWGGGWLASLGGSMGLGHGLVDFGGAGVIFLTGSTVALTGYLLLKSTHANHVREPAEVIVANGLDDRLTVYDEAAVEHQTEAILQTTPMPSAYLPILSMLGAGLILLGWFGLATGVHSPTANAFSSAQAAASGLLAALAAALTAAGYSWFTTREFNPLMTSRGLVAGLIVAMAGAPFIPIWLMVGTGLVIGLLLPSLIYLFDRGLRLGDEPGILATYGLSAIVGLLLVAFLADGQTGQGWNGLGPLAYRGIEGQGVSGLIVATGFAADWPGQLQAQLVGIGAILLWSLLLGVLFFNTINVIARAWAGTGLELADASLPLPAASAKNVHPSQPPE